MQKNFEKRLADLLRSRRSAVIETGGSVSPLPCLARLAGAYRGERAVRVLVIFSGAAELRLMADALRRALGERFAEQRFAVMDGSEIYKKEVLGLRRPQPLVLATPERIIDHLRRANLSAQRVAHVLLLPSGSIDWGRYAQDIEYIRTKLPNRHSLVLVTEKWDAPSPAVAGLSGRTVVVRTADWQKPHSAFRGLKNLFCPAMARFGVTVYTEPSTFSRRQEIAAVKLEKNAIQADNEVLKGVIATILEKIKTEEDPHELNQYRTIIKRNVPIFLRSYFSAYLLKRLHGPSRNGQKSSPRSPSARTLATLFVGIGKNRKVYPRDITSLITGIPGLERSDIGEIKVLDNYSFVEVSESVAQKAIDALNGTDYRGRKLTVNFARKKDEGGQATQN